MNFYAQGARKARVDLGLVKVAEDDKSVALPVASLGGAAALTPLVAPRVLGYQRLYHGTPDVATVQKIQQEGLQPRFGGTGGGRATEAFAEASRGRVHATRFKNLARMYAGLEPDLVETIQRETAERLKAYGSSKPGSMLHSALTTPGDYELDIAAQRGKVHPERIVKMDVPVSHPWESDPHHSGQAVRSSKAVAPEYIHGGANRAQRLRAILRELPASIKARPGRFALGLGGLGAMGALGTYGVSRLMDRS